MKLNNFMYVLPISLSMTLSLNAINYQIATGSEKGTYYKFGKDLSRYVADDVGINLEVVSTKGSVDNIMKLKNKNTPKMKFAIVQNDVMQKFMEEADKGNKYAKDVIKKLRVIAPLYNEEIHILALKESNITTFGDLKNRVIAIGKKDSGSAMTSRLLYKQLFGKVLRKGVFYRDIDDGLWKLNHKKVDAVIAVVGQPYSKFANEFESTLSNHIQLLSYSEANEQHNPITAYYTTEIESSSYKWLNESVPTLSTKAFLVTYSYTNPTTVNNIKNFFINYRKQLAYLKEKASTEPNAPHPKWKKVPNPCDTNLPKGWKRHDIIKAICNNSGSYISKSKSTIMIKSECTENDIKMNIGPCSK